MSSKALSDLACPLRGERIDASHSFPKMFSRRRGNNSYKNEGEITTFYRYTRLDIIPERFSVILRENCSHLKAKFEYFDS